jgi:hypothetical protein
MTAAAGSGPVPARGTEADFTSAYSTLDGPTADMWNESELVAVDGNTVWTVMLGGRIIAGAHRVNRADGPNSYIVTEEPWASEFDEYEWKADDDEDEDSEENIERAIDHASRIDADLLPGMTTPETAVPFLIGALRNAAITPELIERAAQNPARSVRQAAVLHPLVLDATLARIRAETVSMIAESESSTSTEDFTVRLTAHSLTQDKNLVAVIDQVLAYRKRIAE